MPQILMRCKNDNCRVIRKVVIKVKYCSKYEMMSQVQLNIDQVSSELSGLIKLEKQTEQQNATRPTLQVK